MKRPLLISALSAALFASIGAARADEPSSRLYLAGYMGFNTFPDSDFTESSTPASGTLTHKNTVTFGAALGLRIDQRWRVETELSYHKADIDKMNIGGGSFKTGGELTTWLWMVNGYYDFDFEWSYLHPYLMAGVGLADISGSVNDTSTLAVDATGDTLGFAWQAGGGVKVPISDDLSISTDYRYISTSDAEFQGYTIENSAHELRVGIVYDIPASAF
jgi:opacity protein-like surface antigen